MKYIGTLQSIPDSGDKIISHITDEINNIDEQMPGSSSVWVTGYVINHSFVDSFVVNFYNSAREQQQVTIPPRHVYRVKNQNVDRFQLSLDKLSNFAAFSYKMIIVESQSEAESSYLLVYADQQLVEMCGDGDLVTKNISLTITAAVQPIVVESLAGRQTRIKSLQMSVLPSTLPIAQPSYSTDVSVSVNEIDDTNNSVNEYPYFYFFHNYWRAKSDKPLILDLPGTGTSGLEFGMDDNIGTVSIRISLEIQYI